MFALLRQSAGRAIGYAAIPYGFTLTVFASGTAASHFHGRADLGRATLFVVGAGAAYALLAAVSEAPRGEMPMDLRWLGALQALAVVPAAVAAWGLSGAVSGWAGWLLPGFAGCLAYFGCDAVLLGAASSRRREARGRRSPAGR